MHRAAPEIALVDTVGAGDAFMAGLLGALADDRITDPGSLRELLGHPERLGPIVDEAILVASITCERANADPPTRAELAARRSSNSEATL